MTWAGTPFPIIVGVTEDHEGELMMLRTQIQLSEAQATGVKALAARRDVSMAEVIREAIDRMLEEDDRAEKYRQASELVGKFRMGVSDLSANHDEYLTEDNW
jgi:hypothetical protein